MAGSDPSKDGRMLDTGGRLRDPSLSSTEERPHRRSPSTRVHGPTDIVRSVKDGRSRKLKGRPSDTKKGGGRGRGLTKNQSRGTTLPLTFTFVGGTGDPGEESGFSTSQTLSWSVVDETNQGF